MGKAPPSEATGGPVVEVSEKRRLAQSKRTLEDGFDIQASPYRRLVTMRVCPRGQALGVTSEMSPEAAEAVAHMLIEAAKLARVADSYLEA